MKAVLTINDESELKRLLAKKRPITISFRDPEAKVTYTIFSLMIAVMVIGMFWMHHLGYNSGVANGYAQGHADGYNEAVKEVMSSKDLSLYDALAWNLRLNLDRYVFWFGLVVGLAWVFHGVGFTIVKTG